MKHAWTECKEERLTALQLLNSLQAAANTPNIETVQTRTQFLRAPPPRPETKLRAD